MQSRYNGWRANENKLQYKGEQPLRKIINTEHEKLKQRLNKYTSIAQKYSQDKAKALGRSTNAPKKDIKELVPKQIWDYLDRFSEVRAKRLPKSSK